MLIFDVFRLTYFCRVESQAEESAEDEDADAEMDDEDDSMKDFINDEEEEEADDDESVWLFISYNSLTVFLGMNLTSVLIIQITILINVMQDLSQR